MKIGNLCTTKKVIIIAEVGNNHEGNFEVARSMVRRAAEAGADIVKFQTFVTEFFVNPAQKERFERLKTFQLSFPQFEQLSRDARDAGVLFMSTPFDLDSAEFLRDIVPAFKIGSCENTFYPLLKLVASFAKPMVISSGLVNLQQLKSTVDFLNLEFARNNKIAELAILHCVSLYPVKPELANLKAISTLRKELSTEIGYSDHVKGINGSLAAVALGARIVEKHFTLNKNQSAFRDHQLSADPEDFHNLVRGIREIEQMLGSEERDISDEEATQIPLVRRSIVARRAMKAGEMITSECLAWTRPSGGLSPGCEEKLLGNRLRKDVAQGEILTHDILEPRAK